jgi:hypothetical protein
MNEADDRWRDDVWTMKYLSGFKWEMLGEQVGMSLSDFHLKPFGNFHIILGEKLINSIRETSTPSKTPKRNHPIPSRTRRIPQKRRIGKGTRQEKGKEGSRRPGHYFNIGHTEE